MAYEINIDSLDREIDRLRSNEGYLFAGSPKFLGLFGRDSLISSWQLLGYDSSIAKNTLKALAAVQGTKEDISTGEQPGKILHEYYKSGVTSREWFDENKAQAGWLKMDRPEYLSVDSTLLFLIVLSEYYKKTEDMETLTGLWNNAKRAVNWILEYGMRDMFVRYAPTDGKLRSQSWKDGIGKLLDEASSPVAVVEVQGYAYKALKAMEELSHIMKSEELVDKITNTAESLREGLEKFWMDDEQYYAMAIDGKGKQLRYVTSNPGQLLFTGIVSREKADKIVNRVFRRDMQTEYGVRTHSSDDAFFNPLTYQLGAVWPHDNWIIAQGLLEMGYQNQYDAIKHAVINAAMELKAIPEYYGVSKDGKLIPSEDMDPVPCDPQAWSIASLIEFMSHE